MGDYMARKKTMKSKKVRSSSKKLIGITNIPKGNSRGLKPGIALVFGTKIKPRFGMKRFKTITSGKKYALSKGMVK